MYKLLILENYIDNCWKCNLIWNGLFYLFVLGVYVLLYSNNGLFVLRDCMWR